MDVIQHLHGSSCCLPNREEKHKQHCTEQVFAYKLTYVHTHVIYTCTRTIFIYDGMFEKLSLCYLAYKSLKELINICDGKNLVLVRTDEN